jgi:butyrate kinase
MAKRLILAINPGSTSTKFAVFEESALLFERNIRHSSEELVPFEKIADQFHFRKNHIMKALEEQGIDNKRIVAVIGRGGLIHPIESGVYRINDRMKEDLAIGVLGQHACNLGGLIADDIASSLPDALSFVVDPVVVDEMEAVARVSGHPEIERKSIFHALNQKAVGRMYAYSQGMKYEDMNMIIVHMGGGVSVGAHRKGRVIDVNNALYGDGPFSPERSGGLPSGQLVDLCFSGRFTKDQLKLMITGKGGMIAYLGTNDFQKVINDAENGDKYAALIRDAAAYQVSKEIGAMSAVLHGDVDVIILTGGMAYAESHVKKIEAMVKFIAKVHVHPGEGEIEALAFNGLLAIDGKVEIKNYI